MTDYMKYECRSLLQKLKLQQKNLKELIPSDVSCDSSVVSDTYSENFDARSPELKASYARNKLKSFVLSPSNSLNSSIDINTTLDSSGKYSFKPKVYLHDTSVAKPRQYRRSPQSDPQDKDANDKGYLSSRDSRRPEDISANFLRDINNYLDNSRDMTASTLQSDKIADLDDFENMDRLSQASATPPRWSTEKYSSLPSTPNTAQRRKIIDRNIPVTSKYDDFRLNTESSKLNFSYSNVDNDEETMMKSRVNVKNGTTDDVDETFLKSRLNASPEDIFLKKNKDYQSERRERERERFEDRERKRLEEKRMKELEKAKESYNKHLEDSGNDKKYVSIIRDASKPRSILSSPSSRNTSTGNRSKTPSKVSFQSSNISSDTLQDDVAVSSSKMLGYDWIAALLDNETGCMDESESYFNDLKEFRRSNRDECSNNFYMNNPLTFAEPKEASPVVKALTQPKVKPYIVNDRLFTQPLKKNLVDDFKDSDHEDETPTQNSPRYVRVSIPRSTLEQPYKMKPHRRNSFDPTDSCSLREHCLLGWENSTLSALPTASSVDINEATDGLKPKMTTTLAEAERIASTGTQMWPFIPPPSRVDPLPTWRKNYQASVMNLSHPTSTTDSVITGDSESLRKSTNNLLNSTYSLMYEMERLKKERESTKA
ncbi:hypothetical protein SNE40_015457 [Patella caerulea]|uniref:Uncharacterized protein n=1 Tax=Patella caerulea TaxID=87958 RepID=A0AAN8JK10_PATCE